MDRLPTMNFEGDPVDVRQLAKGDRWYLAPGQKFYLRRWIDYHPKFYEIRKEEDGTRYVLRIR